MTPSEPNIVKLGLRENIVVPTAEHPQNNSVSSHSKYTINMKGKFESSREDESTPLGLTIEVKSILPASNK